MSEVLETLAAWAWERHHNVLSWYIRPLFLLPYCWFAYRRSIAGMALALLALVTSMAWFPAPAVADPAVVQMLAVERDYLLGAWTPAKIAAATVVPLTFVALAVALWRRSLGWGLVVVNGAVAFKTGWTFVVDDSGAGALAHLPAAVVGLAVVDVTLIWWCRRRNHGIRPAVTARTADHEGHPPGEEPAARRHPARAGCT
jgi:hypothetical protein